MSQRKVYVASSWRNPLQQTVVAALRAADYPVYDFRDPAPGDDRFEWWRIDPDWQKWTLAQFREALAHPIAVRASERDYNAMRWADTGVLVLPSGRSSHLAAGYFSGAGKDLFILQMEAAEPELMYRLATGICLSVEELLERLAVGADTPRPAFTHSQELTLRVAYELSQRQGEPWFGANELDSRTHLVPFATILLQLRKKGLAERRLARPALHRARWEYRLTPTGEAAARALADDPRSSRTSPPQPNHYPRPSHS